MHPQSARRPLALLAAGATAAAVVAATPAAADAAALPPPVADPSAYVDPFVGTANAGNTFPGAVAPFGMLSFSPGQSRYDGPTSGANAGRGTVRWASPSGYEFGRDTINGFSLTHLSGAGCNGASGDIPVMPVTTAVTTSPSAADALPTNPYASTFSHDNESASPGAYRVALDNGVRTDLSATTRTGSARFAYPAGKPASLLVRTSDSIGGSSDAAVTIDAATRTVSGSVTSGNFCGPYTGDKILQRSYYTLHFTMQFDQPFTATGTWRNGTLTAGGTTSRGGTGYTGGLSTSGSAADGYAPAGKGSGGYLSFAPGSTVNARVGISYVSAAGAKANLAAENPSGTTLEDVRSATKQAWNAELGRIAVGGGTANQKRVFHTALYHSLLHPNVVSDVTRQYPGMDGQAHLLPHSQDAQYTTFSGWDVYRSQVQLLTLLDPKRGSDIAASLLNQADQNDGVWDRWTHVTGGTHVMVGDPSAVALAGITAFGGTAYPMQRAFTSLAEAARTPTPDDYTRAGWNVAVLGQRPSLDQFLEHGYYPEGCNAWGCPNETLEMAAADYGLATLARKLGHTGAYAEFVARSQSWQHQFNPEAVTVDGPDGPESVGYVTGRLADGSWVSGFDPSSSNGFVEGTGAQYVWMVQHNPAGLVDAMGGAAKANARLDSFFRDADGNWVLTGPWDGNVHANMDNEPSIGAAWLYNYTGAPWKTQETVRQTIKQLWLETPDGVGGGPDGIPGNDDLGQMSSWLVFAAMGLYPQNPSQAELTLAAPIFPSVTIHRASGQTIALRAPAAAANVPYIAKLKIDGATSNANFLAASAISKDTTVDFGLSASPNIARGTSPADAPPSNRDGESAFTASLSSPTTSAVVGGVTRPVTLDVHRLSSRAPATVDFRVSPAPGLVPVTPSGTVSVGPDGAKVPVSLRVSRNVPAGSTPVTVTWSSGGKRIGSQTLTVVVGDASQAVLSTGFESGQARPAESERLSSVGFGEYCCGIGGTETKAQDGFGATGSWATIYSARALEPGNHAENVLLSGDQTGQQVAAGDVFSYAVNPQETGGPFGDYVQDASQFVSVDVIFTDGTRLSDDGLAASNGAELTPQSQGAVLDTDTWTTVSAVVPESADGKTVESVTLRFGTGDLVADGSNGYLRGWVDDIAITRALPPLAVASAGRVVATPGTAVTADLASVSGGNPGADGDGLTATVAWGDGSATEVAEVTVTDDGAVVSGTHTYADAGTYRATVTVTDADGVRRGVKVPVVVSAPARTTATG